ncbi:hypothetical protein [Sulfurimonas sp.]|jgi:hypothetical protein|uniref:hypothetical protein n=1 Tax=Sulfurimonas sp. TaxID=2022749 RepID=UPI0025F57A76|nr:hypothetical protein [Sulfurimonas sp.]MCK9473984.1 hypothetical protein [Sulfurimonas sp.]
MQKKDTRAELIEEILLAHDVSYWLKRAIKELMQRDINDVLNDIELLHNIFSLKFKEIKKL